MTPRPRKYALPPNLSYDKTTGRFRYRNPLDGKRTYFGRDKAGAIRWAKQANELVKIRDTPEGVRQFEILRQSAEQDRKYKEHLKSLRHVPRKRRPPERPEEFTSRHYVIKRQTPPWADRSAITEIYEEARRTTRRTGMDHHVDHVIPLMGDTVSGLHCENNLEVIPAHDNCSKHNRFDD